MHYLNFAGWLVFITWIVSDTVPRCLMPLLYPVYDALEEMRLGAWGTGRLGTPLSLTIQIHLPDPGLDPDGVVGLVRAPLHGLYPGNGDRARLVFSHRFPLL